MTNSINLIENNNKQQPKYFPKPPKVEEPLFEELDFGDEKLKPAEIANLKKGDKVAHIRFGIGTVNKIEGSPEDLNSFKGDFEFENGGNKKLLIRYVNLYKVL